MAKRCFRFWIFLVFFLPVRAIGVHNASARDINISKSVFAERLKIVASARMAFAISSMIFRGVEFVNSTDHGRGIQSASSFDDFGECYNPTEAGSFIDGRGVATSSRVLHKNVMGDSFETTTAMAFWLAPNTDYKKLTGNGCGGRAFPTMSVNDSIRSEHWLNKKVTIGFGSLENAVRYDAEFVVPSNFSSSVFEVTTLYSPKRFDRKYIFDLKNNVLLEPAVDGEQDSPVVLATLDGTSAVGLYAPAKRAINLRFGIFSFPDTNKLNCVARRGDTPAGSYQFRCVYLLGTLQEVLSSLRHMYIGAETVH